MPSTTPLPVPILFVCEAVTLAQVVRLVTLARALDPRQYQVHFASARFDEMIFGGTSFVRHAIYSLSPETIEARVTGGRRLYGRRTLARYVAEERALLAAVRPALVVGDLRLSLAVSAPLEKVPYVCLINAYWSPHAVREKFPLPDHPIVRLLGVPWAERTFPKALPHVFAHFARPVNTLRRQHGLPTLGTLPEVLTHGDYTLFADVPALVPTRDLPARQQYLGAISWSPLVPLPAWWDDLDPARPTIYVTMGSSGRVQRLPMVVSEAAAMGFQVLVATAARKDPNGSREVWTGARVADEARRGRDSFAGATSSREVWNPPRVPDKDRLVFVADYLPGHLAARRSLAVVSNGGSTTGYQALSEGRPVLGVAFNLDQYLAMTAIEAAGAGILLRAGTLEPTQVRRALERLTSQPSFTQRAGDMAREFARWNAEARFVAFVEAALADRDPLRPGFGASAPWGGDPDRSDPPGSSPSAA